VLDNRDRKYSKLLARDVDADQLKILEDLRFAIVGIEVGDGPGPARTLGDLG